MRKPSPLSLFLCHWIRKMAREGVVIKVTRGMWKALVGEIRLVSWVTYVRMTFLVAILLGMTSPALTQTLFFSDPVTVSLTTAQSAPAVAGGKNVYIVWDDPNGVLLLARSIDDGNTFSPPLNLSAGLGLPPLPADVDTDEAGNVYVAVASGAIFLARSTDGGETFSVTTFNPAGIQAHHRPSLVVRNNTVYIAWSAVDLPTNQFDIFFALSTDGGLSFSNLQNVSNTTAGIQASADQSLAVDDAGNIYVAWEDTLPIPGTSSFRRASLFSRSLDGGLSFSPATEGDWDRAFPRNQRASLVGGGAGMVHALTLVFQSGAEGSNFFRSTNAGASFDGPTGLFNGLQFLDADIAATPDGTTVYVAASGVIRRSTDGGLTFSQVISVPIGPPAMDTDDAGNVYIAWKSGGVFLVVGRTVPDVLVEATDPDAAETVPKAVPDPGVFTFSRSGDTTNAVTVHFTVGGTATQGDYSAIGTSVTIPAGQTTAMVTVKPFLDALIEGNETVILTLASGAGYTVGSPDTATVTIADYTGGLLKVPPSGVNFGQVQVGFSADRSLTISNLSTTETLVVRVNPTPSPPFSLVSGVETVPPESSRQVRLRFVPIDSGGVRGTLIIDSTDPGTPTATVVLFGNCRRGKLGQLRC